MSDFSSSTSSQQIEQGVDNSNTGSTVASNLDARVSNAGASQSDIADGANQSNARWQVITEEGLVGGINNGVTEVSGASLSFDPALLMFSSGTTTDFAAVFTSTTALSGVPEKIRGTMLYKVRYESDVNNFNLENDHLLGGSFPRADPQESNNAFGFYPTEGGSTSGNVFVKQSGTKYSGTVTYPDITEAHEYTILADAAGNYLSSGTTGFYIDSDPRKGDSPDETINRLPRSFNLGLFYSSDLDSQPLTSDYLEVRHRG